MVRHVSATYHRIRASRLRLGCAVGVGVPLERALNKYAEAANAWGRCLATAGCEARAIEPKVQRDWRVAGDYLEEAGA